MARALAGFQRAVADLSAWPPRVAAGFRALTPSARLRILLFVVLGLQCAKMWRLVPIDTLLNGDPLTEYHYSQIYRDISDDRLLSATTGSSWGYNPYIGAGQPVGAGVVEESHAPILLDRLLRRWIDPTVTVKLFVWMTILAAPLLIFGAARLVGLSEAATAIAVALTAAGSLGHELLSRALIYKGNVAFWLAAHVALFNAAAFFAAVLHDSRKSLAAFALTLPLVALLDPAVAIVQVVPIAAMISAVPLRRRMVVFGAIVTALALTIVINGFWLRPFFEFHPFSTRDMEWPTPGVSGFIRSFFPAGGFFLVIVWTAVRACVLIFGLTELFLTLQEKRRLSRAMLTWAGVLFFVGFFGGNLAWIAQFEPGRFSFLLMLVLSLPASAYMADVFLKPGSRRILLFVWALWFGVTWQTVHLHEPVPVRQNLVARETRLLKALARLPRDRRVLIEHTATITDAMRISGGTNGLAYAGFPTSWWNTMFGRSAIFQSRGNHVELFGKSLATYDGPELAAMLNQYNVGLVVITTKEAKKLIDDFPGLLRPLRATTPDDDFWIYHTQSKDNGYVLEGKGRVTFNRDGIRITNAAPGPILLSFHWLEGFRSTPPLPVRGRLLENDRVPFIAIDNAAGEKEIVLRYETR